MSADEPARLRVVHVISSLGVGGLERFVLQLAAHQRRRGDEVEVATLRDGPLARFAAELSVPVARIEGERPAVRALRWAAYLRRVRPDILHAHNPVMLRYGAIGRLVSGARLVVTDHGGRPYRAPWAAEWRLVDAVAAVSAATARASLAAGVCAIEVIHNGAAPLEAPSRAASRAAFGLGDDAFVVVCVARLVAVKAHEVLLQALARCRGAPTLLVVGDGPEREGLAALAAGLGLSGVRFLGACDDVGAPLAAADVVVLASRDEGLPMALLEAMAQGLPIVATAVGGIPELVRDGVEGLLVPTGDVDALVAALARVAEDPALRSLLGAAGRRRAAERFTLAASAAAYAALYRRLLG